MCDLELILSWLEEKVEGTRRSRAKSRAAIVGGAMRMNGTGILASGRAMEGATSAKHRIKRVDRFLDNEQVEIDLVNEVLFRQFRPRDESVVVLADRTDCHAFRQLMLALPCDGRSIPFYSITVEKRDGTGGAHEGLMIRVEGEALDALCRRCGNAIRSIIIANRGFGNTGWLGDNPKQGDGSSSNESPEKSAWKRSTSFGL